LSVRADHRSLSSVFIRLYSSYSWCLLVVREPFLPFLEGAAMRRLLTVALAALIAVAAHARQAKQPMLPALNVGNAKLVATSPDVGSPLLCVAVSEDKGVLIAGCEDGTLRRWKVEPDKDPINKDNKGETVKAHACPVTCCAAAGAVLLTGSTDGKVLVWNLPADKAAHTIDLKVPVRAVAVSADGKLAAACGDSNDVHLIDPSAGKTTKKLEGAKDWMQAAAFSPDGKFVAAGGHDGKLWLWESATGKKVFDVLAQSPPKAKEEPATNVVHSLAFSPDGKQIALGGTDPKGCIFQASDGKFLRNYVGHSGTITGQVFHPAGQILFTTSKDRTVKAFNPAAGNQLKSLDGHTAWVEGCVLLQQGTKLVTVGADRTARLWDLGAPPKKK
jgi:WD40 repeat protein